MDPWNESSAAVDLLLKTIVDNTGLSLSYALAEKPGETPALEVCFTGPDVPHLLARNAELLLALEHIATQALGLAPEEHDAISFDAGNFKHNRTVALERAAEKAVHEVQASHRPFHFPPMNSRERRLLHLALNPTNLSARSEGEGAARHLVLHPKS